MALNTSTTSNQVEPPTSAAGLVLGHAADSLVGMYGATPISQRTSSAQAAVVALAGTLTGTTDGTIADIAATAAGTAGGATPTAAQVDTGVAAAVATIVTGTNTQIKELQTTLNSTVLLVNELRAALVALGAIKGS